MVFVYHGQSVEWARIVGKDGDQLLLWLAIGGSPKPFDRVAARCDPDNEEHLVNMVPFPEGVPGDDGEHQQQKQQQNTPPQDAPASGELQRAGEEVCALELAPPALPTCKAGAGSRLKFWCACIPLNKDRDQTHYVFKLIQGKQQLWLDARGELVPRLPGKEYHFRFNRTLRPPSWVPHQIFYQIFPDRFCNGDPSISVREGEYTYLDNPVHARPWGAPVTDTDEARCSEFYGGDLIGVRQKLAYLHEELGVTALYLNPIFTSLSNHKYDTVDYMSVDRHLGGNDALIALRRATRDLDMRLVLDAVLNHTSVHHYWFDKYADANMHLQQHDAQGKSSVREKEMEEEEDKKEEEEDEKEEEEERALSSLGAFGRLLSPFREFYFFHQRRQSTTAIRGSGVEETITTTATTTTTTTTAATSTTGPSLPSLDKEPAVSAEDGGPKHGDGDDGEEFAAMEGDHYVSWLGFDSLPKLNLANQAVRDYLYAGETAVVRHWLRPPYAIDGWRFDVIHMLGEGAHATNNAYYVRELRRATKETNPSAYVLGEHFYEATQWLQGDQEDGCMAYYTFQHPIRAFFSGTDLQNDPIHIDASHLSHWLRESRAKIPWTTQLALLNQLDSHDTQRMLTLLGGDTDALKAAATVLFAYPGTPCIYYGDEVGLEGGKDPDCRRCFPWDREQWQHGVFSHFQRLVRARKRLAALQIGAYVPLYAEGDVLAFARWHEGQVVVCVAARRHEATQSPLRLHIPVWRCGLEEATLHNVLHCDEEEQPRELTVSRGMLDIPRMQSASSLLLVATQPTADQLARD